MQMSVEGGDEIIPLLLCVFDHLACGILGQVLHKPALQGDPEGSGSKKQDGLADQAEGDPLVEGVKHLVAILVLLGFAGTTSLGSDWLDFRLDRDMLSSSDKSDYGPGIHLVW